MCKPTIEERYRDACNIIGDIDYKHAALLAGVIAAERTAPLVAALRRLHSNTAACDERCTDETCAYAQARAALAAEEEARRG